VDHGQSARHHLPPFRETKSVAQAQPATSEQPRIQPVGSLPLPPDAIWKKSSLTRKAAIAAAIAVTLGGFRGAVTDKTPKEGSDKDQGRSDGQAFEAVVASSSRKKQVWRLYNSEGRGRDGRSKEFRRRNLRGGQRFWIWITRLMHVFGLESFLGYQAATMSMDVIEGTNGNCQKQAILSGGSSRHRLGVRVPQPWQSAGYLCGPDRDASAREHVAEFRTPTLGSESSVRDNLRRIAIAVQGNFSDLEVVIIARDREMSRIQRCCPRFPPEATKPIIQKAIKDTKTTPKGVVLIDPHRN